MRPKGFKHSKDTRLKISLANTGSFSSQWKGDKANYQALHTWIRTHHGKADCCENPQCEGKSRQYQWALRPGRKYSRQVEDYIKLCRSCHQKMDYTEERRQKISKATRKFFTCTIPDCSRIHLAKGYCRLHYFRLVRKIKH